MLRRSDRGDAGGAGLVVLCVLSVVFGRHLYSGLSATLTEPAQAATLSSGGGSGSGNSPYSSPRSVGVLEDKLIRESSGLVASRKDAEVLWTHNDSGDYDPYLFCLHLDGSSCGRWTVPGVDDNDWEDIAAGPGLGGDGQYLYIGDIGDNGWSRRSISVHVLPEPTVPTDADLTTTGQTEGVVTVELTYPDGPHDAETLMVHPITGDLYIVTKQGNSRSGVYKAEAPLGEHEELQRIASFRIYDNFSERTGGDISPDGTRVIFGTYLKAYEKRVPPGNFDSVWGAPAVAIDLGPIRQREAIAYRLDGKAILSTNEGMSAQLVQAELK